MTLIFIRSMSLSTSSEPGSNAESRSATPLDFNSGTHLRVSCFDTFVLAFLDKRNAAADKIANGVLDAIWNLVVPPPSMLHFQILGVCNFWATRLRCSHLQEESAQRYGR